jgi:hypothetical protein
MVPVMVVTMRGMVDRVGETMLLGRGHACRQWLCTIGTGGIQLGRGIGHARTLGANL